MSAHIATAEMRNPYAAEELIPVPPPLAFPYAKAVIVPERSAYDGARGNTVAGIGALALTAGIIAAFAFMNAVQPHKAENGLKIFHVNLDTPPPPAPTPPKKQVKTPDVPVLSVAVVKVPNPVQQSAPPPPPLPALVSAPPSPPVANPGPPTPPAPPAKPKETDLSAKLVSAKPPSYPAESRQLKEQGTVILYIIVAPDGHVDQVSVRKSSGFFRLDRAALEAVKHWRWSPTVVDGQAVEVRGIFALPFTLQGKAAT